jgi:hypothetical protein
MNIHANSMGVGRCGHCQSMSPEFRAAAAEVAEMVCPAASHNTPLCGFHRPHFSRMQKGF